MRCGLKPQPRSPPALTVRAEQRFIDTSIARVGQPSLLSQPLGRGHWEPRGSLLLFWQRTGSRSPAPAELPGTALCPRVRFPHFTQLLLAAARWTFFISAQEVLKKEKDPTHQGS